MRRRADWRPVELERTGFAAAAPKWADTRQTPTVGQAPAPSPSSAPLPDSAQESVAAHCRTRAAISLEPPAAICHVSKSPGAKRNRNDFAAKIPNNDAAGTEHTRIRDAAIS